MAAMYYFKPSSLETFVWSDPFPLPELSGPTTPNTRLASTQKVGLGQLAGAESMAIDEDDGTLYASLQDGRVVHLSEKGDFLSTLFFAGGYMASDPTSRTNGVDASTAKKMAWCTSQALANHGTGERSCGRPLGIRYLPAGSGVGIV
jgi:hypothetical protein